MSPGQIRQPVNHDLYCTACPREDLVTNLLKGAGYLLVQQLGAQRATTHLPALPAQYHYEGTYGVTIVYMAGYDASHDAQGKRPPQHAARIYVKGNTDPRSQEQLQQVITTLKRLPVPFLGTKTQQQASA